MGQKQSDGFQSLFELLDTNKDGIVAEAQLIEWIETDPFVQLDHNKHLREDLLAAISTSGGLYNRETCRQIFRRWTDRDFDSYMKMKPKVEPKAEKKKKLPEPVDPVKREEKVKKAIQKAFEFYDMNHSGNIEYLELAEFFRQMYQNCKDTFGVQYNLKFDQFDMNKDGKVTFEEFDAVVRRTFLSGPHDDASLLVESINTICPANRQWNDII